MYKYYFSICKLCPQQDEKLKYRWKFYSEAESLMISP